MAMNGRYAKTKPGQYIQFALRKQTQCIYNRRNGFRISNQTSSHRFRNSLSVSLASLRLEDLALVALGREHDVVLKLERGLGVTLEGLEVDDEVVLDGEDGVSLEPGVVLGVELRRAALEVVMGDLCIVSIHHPNTLLHPLLLWKNSP